MKGTVARLLHTLALMQGRTQDPMGFAHSFERVGFDELFDPLVARESYLPAGSMFFVCLSLS